MKLLSLDNVAYTKIIHSSTKSGHWIHGKLGHSHMIKTSFNPCQFLLNTLLNFYVKCSEFDSALKLFDKMPKRDVTSWNLMISGYSQMGSVVKALKVLRDARVDGLKLDKFSYASGLAVCGQIGEVKLGMVIHGLIVVNGLAGKVFLTNSLIDMYSKCGRIDKARCLFENSDDLDDVSWNSMISGYIRSGFYEEVLRQFVKMQQCGCRLSSYVIGSVLKACCLDFDCFMKCGKSVHGCVVKLGLDLDVIVGTALLDMYARHGDLGLASCLFQLMPDRNVVLYNAMIAGFVRTDYDFEEFGEQALALFSEMQRQGIRPTMFTFASILKACNVAEAFDYGKQIHAQICKNNLQSDEFIASGLVELYSLLGSIDDASKCFNLASKLDIVSWTSMISCLVQNRQYERAAFLFNEVMASGMKPDEFIMSSMFSASAGMTAARSGEQTQGYALKTGISSFVSIQNSQLSMYAECGDIASASRTFEKIENPDIVSWSTMLRSYAQYGCPREALSLFELMMENGVMPNHITFLGILTACSHGGLVEEGLRYFESMREDYSLIPNVKHYACVVDLLGRAGRLADAEKFIVSSCYKDNPIIWRSLLSSCRIHKDTIVGRRIADKVIELEPQASSSYVLLYNIYSDAGIEDPAKEIRDLMHDRDMRKEPGLSWIEVGKIIHSFVSGDVSHPETRLI